MELRLGVGGTWYEQRPRASSDRQAILVRTAVLNHLMAFSVSITNCWMGLAHLGVQAAKGALRKYGNILASDQHHTKREQTVRILCDSVCMFLHLAAL